MAWIYCADKAGMVHKIPATEGQTLLEIIRGSGLELAGLCGGLCACGTCHIYVDPAWIDRVPEIKEDEAGMLDGAFDVTPHSRLACQIVFTNNLDGLRVSLVR